MTSAFKLLKSIHIFPFVPDLPWQRKVPQCCSPVSNPEAILISLWSWKSTPSEAWEENSEHIKKGGGVSVESSGGKNKTKLTSEAMHWNSHFWAAEAEVTPVIGGQPCYSSELSGLSRNGSSRHNHRAGFRVFSVPQSSNHMTPADRINGAQSKAGLC